MVRHTRKPLFQKARAFAYGLHNKPAPLSGDVLNGIDVGARLV